MRIGNFEAETVDAGIGALMRWASEQTLNNARSFHATTRNFKELDTHLPARIKPTLIQAAPPHSTPQSALKLKPPPQKTKNRTKKKTRQKKYRSCRIGPHLNPRRGTVPGEEDVRVRVGLGEVRQVAVVGGVLGYLVLQPEVGHRVAVPPLHQQRQQQQRQPQRQYKCRENAGSKNACPARREAEGGGIWRRCTRRRVGLIERGKSTKSQRVSNRRPRRS